MSIALSWSRWSDFDQCPRKFFLKYMDKAPNFQMKDADKSPHLVRGQNLHKQLEDYALWKIEHAEALARGESFEKVEPAMSPETAALKPAIDTIMQTSDFTLPETQLCVNKDWQKRDWFAKDAYYRAIMDLIAGRRDHGILWDYKSGKYAPYSDECGQLHLSAAMVIKMKGWSYVDVSYLFIDSKKPASVRVTQEQVPGIIRIFDERHARVNSEVKWEPRRNDNCGWCDARPDQCPNSKKPRSL
jgi:CRISPR/Cas system-associated exonuclease Cas4 (RecB family)